MGLLRSIFYWISSSLYELIPSIYNLVDKIVSINGKVKDVQVNETTGEVTITDILNVDKLSRNIYLLMAAIMLFAFAIRLLSSIVNPDSLFDKKKGVQQLLVRSLIGIIMIGGVPLAFDKAYEFQADVLDKNLIARYIFGMEITDETSVGDTIMAQSFTAFVYPQKEEQGKTAIRDSFNQILNGDTNGFDKLGRHINDKYNDEYAVKFHFILSPLFAIYMCYQLILLCIDMALRTFKLIFLEVLTPLIICAYIYSENDILKKWLKEVTSTFLIVFTKLIGLYFMAYGLSLLDKLIGLGQDVSEGFIENGLIHAFIMIGLLQLVKQIPDIFNKIFGIKIENQGGIGGRLAGMAGVGDIAKRGWDTIRQHPIQSIGRPVGAVAGIATNAVNSTVRRGIDNYRRNGSLARAIGSGVVGVGGAVTGSVGAARRGWNTGALRSISGEVRRYGDTHQPGSTWRGRTTDRFLTAIGVGTREEIQARHDNVVEHRDRRMTFDELQARQKLNNNFDEERNKIRSQIETSIDREASNVEIGVSYNSTRADGTTLAVTLNGNTASIRKQIESINNASVDELRAAYGVRNTIEKNQLVAELNAAYARERNNTLDIAENSIWQDGVDAQIGGHRILATGGDVSNVNEALNRVTDLVNSNDDLRTIITSGHTNTATGVITTSTLSTAPDGQIRLTNFRDGARSTVSDEQNLINREVTAHNREIEQRQATAQGREQHASAESVKASRENPGGNSNSGNRH